MNETMKKEIMYLMEISNPETLAKILAILKEANHMNAFRGEDGLPRHQDAGTPGWDTYRAKSDTFNWRDKR